MVDVLPYSLFSHAVIALVVLLLWDAWRHRAFVRALRRAARRGHSRLVMRALRGPEAPARDEQEPPASAPPSSMTRPTSDPPPRWRTVARRRVRWTTDGLGLGLDHATAYSAAQGAP